MEVIDPKKAPHGAVGCAAWYTKGRASPHKARESFIVFILNKFSKGPSDQSPQTLCELGQPKAAG